LCGIRAFVWDRDEIGLLVRASPYSVKYDLV
jgi:hypothetical protein